MGERTLQAKDFPEPARLVGALQSYLRLTPGAPEYGAIGGRGYDRVVYGPLFTTFVLGQTCRLLQEECSPNDIQARSDAIHEQARTLRFETGRIIPSVGRQVLHEYAQNRMADPRVEVARRLAVGLEEQDHESVEVAKDVQIILSRVALDGGFGEVLNLPEQDPDSLQAPIPDVA